ncbi:hypothetical protein O7622_11315 [Micromonospora sp. WMMD1076]|uniref:hypothetical protein n=1 Tax=Micromonospora sp. WMMD1076 TaxID=3016103 RepID=UPI00249A1025|nr:hypothetical protein [Micromonospora sp. WMMD1076]WFF09099.1 hypothetical protein O7622_11315 [Micromonospora sp. WMMD1076]
MTFSLVPLAASVELLIGGNVGWVDITEDVRLESASSGGGIQITRGMSAEGRRADPGRCLFTVDNRSGRYSPRNPMGEWFGLFGRNTPVRVGVDLTADSFTRTVGAGWGQTDDGRTWAPYSGTNADLSVNGSHARMLHPTINVVRGARLDQDWQDAEQVTRISVPAVATGASVVAGHVARHQTGSGDYYWLRLEFDVAGAISAKISKRVGGVWTELAVSSQIPGLSYTAGQWYNLRSSVCGRRLSLKVWPDGTPEPVGWMLSAVDDSILTPGRTGLASWVVGGNTNTSPEVRFDGYRVVNRRFFGEIAEWPLRGDVGGFDQWVPVEAFGILRRLNMNNAPVKSPLRRTIEATSPVAYWPGEDGRSSNSVASAIAGHPPLLMSGSPEFVDVEDYVGQTRTFRYGSASLVDLSTGTMMGARTTSGVTAATGSAWTVHVRADVDPSSISGDFPLIEWACADGTRYRIVVNPLGSRLVRITKAGTATTLINGDLPLGLAAWSVSAKQTGGNITYTYRSAYDQSTVVAGSLTGIQQVALNPDRATATRQTCAGHLAIWSGDAVPYLDVDSSTDVYGQTVFSVGLSAWNESAQARMVRLCAEEGIPLDIAPVGSQRATRMGWQPTGTLLELLAECVEVEGGVLVEQRDGLGLAYRSRWEMYNQDPVPLSYGQLSPPFEPVEDDRALANVVTVERSGGSSVTLAETSGPLAALDMPVGVGVYESSTKLNLATDGQLRDQAGWRLHLGTVSEARYPSITVDFSAPPWVASGPALTSRAQSLDSGDILVLTDLPAWCPPGPVKAMVRGYTESLDAFRWDLTWNAAPGSPWYVGAAQQTRVASGRGHSRLALPVAAADLAATMVTSLENGPWTEDPAHFPQNLVIGGELVTVSAIGPAVSDTFTRTVSNGWGLSWDLLNGAASEYAVSGTVGTIAPAVVNSDRLAAWKVGGPDQDVKVLVKGLASNPVGANVSQGLVSRLADGSNFYRAVLGFTPAGAVGLFLHKRVGGVLTALGAGASLTGAATQDWYLRLECRGDRISAKAWPASGTEPRIWQVVVTDSSLPTGDYAGVVGRRETGNTSPLAQGFDNFVVLNPQKLTISARAVNGVARGWSAGTEVQIEDPRVFAL